MQEKRVCRDENGFCALKKGCFYKKTVQFRYFFVPVLELAKAWRKGFQKSCAEVLFLITKFICVSCVLLVPAQAGIQSAF